MSDETTPEATASEESNTPSTQPDEQAGGGNGDRPDGSAAPRRRRRRGSRGGRKRKKPASRTAEGGAAEPSVPEDHTDPAADRGLTSDDVAAEAKEDAGLADGDDGADSADRAGATSASTRPKIGDRRPAPPKQQEQTEAKSGGSRRRRRGGRGRGRGRGGGEAVQADLGVGDVVELDDEVLERRRGQTRKGRPAGRYLMCVHVHPETGATHIAVLEGRSLVEHTVGSTKGDDH